MLKNIQMPAGKRSHMSSSKSCSWYRFGKLADLCPLDYGNEREGGAIGIQADGGGLGQDENDDEDVAEVFNDLLEQEEELFHFVPQSSLQQESADVLMENGEAGPGPSTLENRTSRFNAPQTLDDSDDNRIEEIHPTAGRVIRIDKSLHRR